MGRLFNTDSEFLQVSTDGEHEYVVRTFVWLLPEKGRLPILLMDVPGLVSRIQEANSGPCGAPGGSQSRFGGYETAQALQRSNAKQGAAHCYG